MRKLTCLLLSACLLLAVPVFADCVWIYFVDQDPQLVCSAPCFDPNNDGVVSVLDLFALNNYINFGGSFPTGPADFNHDGVVNQADFDGLFNFLFCGGPPPQC